MPKKHRSPLWNSEYGDDADEKQKERIVKLIHKYADMQAEKAVKYYAKEGWLSPCDDGSLAVNVEDGVPRQKIKFSEIVDAMCDHWNKEQRHKWAKRLEDAAKKIRKADAYHPQ